MFTIMRGWVRLYLFIFFAIQGLCFSAPLPLIPELKLPVCPAGKEKTCRVDYCNVSPVSLKTMGDYWRDTGLTFSFLEEELTSDKCYENLRNFIACFEAVDTIITYRENTGGNQIKLVPDEFEGKNTTLHIGDMEAPEGLSFLLVPQKNNLDVQSLFKLQKSLNSAINNSRKKLFEKKQKEKIDFKGILSWLKLNIILNTRIEEAEITAVAWNAYLAISESPHNRIEPEAYYSDMANSNSESYRGIGVYVERLHDLFLIKPMENSPAAEAGLKANDIISGIDGKKISGLLIQEVVRLLRGPEGTTVYIDIIRDGKPIDTTFPVQRGEIITKNVTSKILSGPHNYGYVKLASFRAKDPCTEIKNAISKLAKDSISGIIFDLRNNGGGRLDHATCIADIFLESGLKVFSVKDLSFGVEKPYHSETPAFTDLPLITIINAYSASASELVSGALQDHERSFIIGEPSYGKGTVQEAFLLKEGILKFETTQRFYLPSGRTNQISGITPHLKVYSGPSLSEKDTFAIREGDKYLYALPSTGKIWVEPESFNGISMKSIKKCITESEKEKISHRKETYKTDYQLFIAENSLECLINLQSQ